MEKLKFNSEEAENNTGKKRREHFEDYEREVLGKMENIAIARHEIQGVIAENPDISVEDLKFEFNSRISGLDLLPEQRGVAHSCVERYVALHNAVKRYREKFPDDADLFKAVFGRTPRGKVEIKTGPMTMFFICYDIEDYATVYTGKRDLNDRDVQIARRSGGVSTGRSPESTYGLGGAIIAENCADHSYPIEKIRTHEEQHAIHRLFDKPLSGAGYEYYFSHENDPEKRKFLALRYFRYRREEIGEHRVADEILAYEKEGRDKNEIMEILMQKTDKGGLYGYFDEVKKELADRYVQVPDIEDIIHEVFVVEYEKLVADALTAFDDLRKFTDLNVDEGIAYFTMIPIRHWPKMVKRRKKLLAVKSFNERVLVKENRFWRDYECLAEEFDRIGNRRHKQKNKKIK